MIKAIIFDFDGLILDTETPWFEAYREVFREEGGELPLEEWAKVIGTSFHIFDPFAYLAGQIGKPVKRKHIETRAAEKYKSLVKSLVVRPGVEDYLKCARKLGLQVGLSSSSTRNWVESYLMQFQLFDYFDILSTKDDVNRIKPEPDLYLRTMELLGVSGNEAVAFEDSLNGLKAAKAAGLYCVVVPNTVTGHLPFEGESLRLSSMADMPLQEVLARMVQ